MRLINTLVLALLLGCPMFGQQLQFENVSSSVPIPSQECYNIMQDSKGYIWFSTEQGLCRYNGTSIKVFDRSNGLPEGAVYAMVEDSDGRLWIVTCKNRILVYEKGTLKEAAFSKNFVSQLSPIEITYSLTLAGRHEIYINSEVKTFFADTRTNRLTKIPTRQLGGDYGILHQNGQFIMVNAYRDRMVNFPRYFSQKYFGLAVMEDNGVVRRLRVKKAANTMPAGRTVLVASQGESFFLARTTLVRLGKNGSVSGHILPQRILSLHKDKDGGLWVGLYKEGLYYYRHGDLSEKPIISLKGYSVSGVIGDAEKNIWCTTLESGIFFCRNKDIVNYFNIPGLSKPVDLLKSIGNAVYFSSGTRELIKWEKDTVSRYEVGYSREALCDICKFGDKWYVSGKEFTAWTDSDFRRMHYIMRSKYRKVNISSRQMKAIGRKFYGIGYQMIREIGERHMTLMGMFLDRWGTCLESYKPGVLLYGALEGLYALDIRTHKSTRISGIDDPVTAISNTGWGIWITTKGGGLYRLMDGKAIAMNKKLGIPATILFDIAAEKKALWIASNKGLIKVSREGGHLKSVLFDTRSGLPANEIYKLAVRGRELFLSTLRGVCSFSTDRDQGNPIPPKIYLETISINGITQGKSTGKRYLEHDENSLRFAFDALAFKGMKVRLRYKVKGRDRSFRTVQGNEVFLDNLSPGNYTLTVFALNSDGVQSLEPVNFSFEIARPFWLQWWFLLCCLLLAALAVYFFIRRNIEKIRVRETEKTRINKLISDSQLTALQAQMNPHFIFNAINSIQNYILKRQEKEAYNYLAKFSKLIRIVLHNSQQQLLFLHDELETIGLYMELEQLRFEDSFDFTCEIDERIEQMETVIPTMIIQPYLENAIWHGIMNLEGKRHGKITLCIDIEGELLRIEITDNGIGRILAKRYKEENTHQPVAMKLTQQRLSIVNQSLGSCKIEVAITDIYDGQGQAAGTRVTLYLPISNTD